MKNEHLPAAPIGEQIDAMHLNPDCNGLTKVETIAMHLFSGMLSRCDSNGYSASAASNSAIAVSQAYRLLKALDNYSPEG